MFEANELLYRIHVQYYTIFSVHPPSHIAL